MMLDNFVSRARQVLYLDSGLHLEGNREMFIENCSRIEEYNEVFMRLIAGGLCIQIWGTDLRAYDYATGGLIIRGRIAQIELTEGGIRHEGADERLREDRG